MTHRPWLAVALAFLLAAPALAQDPPKEDPPKEEAPKEEKPKQELEANKEEAKEESAAADAEAAKAGHAVTVAQQKADAARQQADAAAKALEAAKAKQTAAKDALAQAEEAADAAADAAQAEGATAAQKEEAAAKAKALEDAKAALAQAKQAVEVAEQARDDTQALAKAAEEELEAAKESIEEAADKRAEAEAKVKAVDAAKKAMERVANMRRGAAVPVEELELRLVPLDKAELEAEVGEWIAVLKTKVSGISYAEIAAKTSEGEEKQLVLEALTKLRAEKTAVIDRLNVVLTEFETKGGDAKEHHLYVDAVSGKLHVDVQDASATYTALMGWVKSPEGGIRWGKNLLLFLGTLVVFKILSSVVGGMVGRALRMQRVKASELLKEFLTNISRKAVWFIGFVVALDMLEVNIGPFLAAMGGVAFVLGFALQGTLSNFAAGIMILLYRPFDIGHVVEVAGVKGSVQTMSLVSTSLVTPDNQLIIVPNSSIWGGIITNVTSRTERRVDMVFGIGYEDDIAKAEAILAEILEAHPKVLASPAPVIKLGELADSSVNFIVRPWCKTGDFWDVSWDVTRTVKERFDEAGISIPYPQTDVHVHQVSAAPVAAGESA